MNPALDAACVHMFTDWAPRYRLKVMLLLAATRPGFVPIARSKFDDISVENQLILATTRCKPMLPGLMAAASGF